MAIKTIEEFGKAIVDGVDADPESLPKGRVVGWFAGPDGRPTYFEINKPSPLDSFSVVIGIFPDDDVVRVYTMPRAVPNPRPEKWIDKSPARLTLTRTAATYVDEAFSSMDALADAMIDEWNLVASGQTSAEVELDAVCDFIEALGADTPTYSLTPADLVEALRAGEHHDLGGEDDEDETPTDPAVGAAAPPPAAVGSATAATASPLEALKETTK